MVLKFFFLEKFLFATLGASYQQHFHQIFRLLTTAITDKVFKIHIFLKTGINNSIVLTEYRNLIYHTIHTIYIYIADGVIVVCGSHCWPKAIQAPERGLQGTSSIEPLYGGDYMGQILILHYIYSHIRSRFSPIVRGIFFRLFFRRRIVVRIIYNTWVSKL